MKIIPAMPSSSTILDKVFVTPLIRPRNPRSHKGNHGHALLIAGSKGRMGAAVLSATACLRTGVGLLTVNIPGEERLILQTTIPEAMLMMREEGGDVNKFNALAVGPALGLDDLNVQLLENIFEIFKGPIVLDADALSLLGSHESLWPVIPAGAILTPHPIEFDRMFGESTTHENRIAKAITLSEKYPWVIVLKNYSTIIFQDGQAFTNTTGNAGLAKGGSGDVLTGMILSLLAQGYSSNHAALIAVYLHGLSADIAVKNQSQESLLASDVIECIGKAFREMTS